MKEPHLDLTILRLGECRIPSPMDTTNFVSDEDHILYHSNLPEIQALLDQGKKPPYFEIAGPRENIYFDPAKLKCGIVTCGGLCPGLNDVIRSIVLGLYHHYGVKTVFGFPFGYEGLTYRHGHTPLELTPEIVKNIHMQGGTILASSRGPQDVSEMGHPGPIECGHPVYHWRRRHLNWGAGHLRRNRASGSEDQCHRYSQNH